ncbi:MULTISPECIES: hypothetical protein [unclassified Streptomyces]|uniref:hypothetical protein n=1 Tax=unclassified Streptomyces TaxID=2593676 RepID=UPI0022715DD2|nr:MULTISPECIES: hypothetical protein [unclassified Streptomyces]MCY0921970.1 hypothetical protein [Streptomyces sp. H27-G5]MCY0960648.1 hypothetical protein [Streptomyces sp. H27-H5]
MSDLLHVPQLALPFLACPSVHWLDECHQRLRCVIANVGKVRAAWSVTPGPRVIFRTFLMSAQPLKILILAHEDTFQQVTADVGEKPFRRLSRRDRERLDVATRTH